MNTSQFHNRDAENDTQHDRFVERVQENSNAIRRCIMTLCPDRYRADDIMQETLVILWKKYQKSGPPDNFRTWSCTVAYNVTRNFLRKQKNLNRIVSFSEEHLSILQRSHSGLSEFLELRAEYLRNCMKKLTVQERELLTKFYVERRSAKDISRELKKTQRFVYNKLNRIRRLMFECVNRRMGQEESE